MAKQVPNHFTSWTFDTPQEEKQARMLTEGNIYLIHNERAKVRVDIMNNRFDSSKPVEFAQTDSYLKGQLAAFDWLLAQHFDLLESLSNIDNEFDTDNSPI